jgi:hypothetical protein
MEVASRPSKARYFHRNDPVRKWNKWRNWKQIDATRSKYLHDHHSRLSELLRSGVPKGGSRTCAIICADSESTSDY